MANTFKFGNGKWAVKDGAALAYNDENNNFKPLPFDFTRASSATRVNREGLIKVVGQNKPRIDFTDNTSGHLLLEPSRTNYLRYSEDLSQSNWVKTNNGTGLSPVVTSNYATSPDGTQNASRVQFDLNGGTTISDRSKVYQDAGTGSSGNQAYSVYMKSNDSSSHILVFRALGGALFQKTITTEWQRFTIDASDNSFYFEIGLYGDSATSDTADILIWGAQMEEGSYPTSYIPNLTSSSSVTRSDEYAIDAGNSIVFSDTELSWFLDIEGFAEDGTTRYISISDGGGSPYTNGYAILYRNDGNLRIFRNGLDFADAICIVNIDQTIRQKIAIRFKQNDMKVYINGVSQSLNGGYVFQSISGVDRMRTNQQNSTSGSNAFDGKIYEMKVWNEALSDSELQALTS